MSALWPTERYSTYIKGIRDFQDNIEAICLSARQFERETMLKLKYGIPIRQRRYAQVSCSSHETGLTSTYHITSDCLRLTQGIKLEKGRYD